MTGQNSFPAPCRPLTSDDSPLARFADFRCSDAENLQQKFARLLKTAGIAKIGLDGKFTAVKTHFGGERTV